MASLFRAKGRWVVAVWVSKGVKQLSRFGTEQEARDFMAREGLTAPGYRGRRSRTRDELLDHVAANFEIDSETDCWVWTNTLSAEGYGVLNWREPEGRTVAGAHRLVVHLTVDPVPAHLVTDHLCRNRACVNPDHLEVVVQRENVMRSPIAPGALNAAKTHCPQGHPYSPENTYVYTPSTRKTVSRICKTCRAAYQRNRYFARKAAA